MCIENKNVQQNASNGYIQVLELLVIFMFFFFVFQIYYNEHVLILQLNFKNKSNSWCVYVVSPLCLCSNLLIKHRSYWIRAYLIAQSVKNLLATQETQVQSWIRKIPQRRKWQPTPVLLPGESHGQGSLAGHSPRGCKSWTRLSDFTTTTTILDQGPP